MKLVIADLDGTLMHKKVMSDKTKQTIKLLQDQHIGFTLATGRHKNATRALVKTLDINLPVILTNGAFIYDFVKDKVIHQDTIDEQLLYMLIDHLVDFDFLVYTTKDIVSTQKAKQSLEARIGPFESIETKDAKALRPYFKDGVLKLLVIEHNANKLSTLRNKLSNIEGIYLLQSQASFLDIGSKYASKGRAVSILSEYLNVDLNDVLAIGDQENDVSMIETAGLGVAMGNSEAVLKEHADFITKNFDEEGFTYAIETHILK